jgi:uncharacterized DUF497 family protein
MVTGIPYKSMPNFEWEPEKAASNLRSHKVTFDAARAMTRSRSTRSTTERTMERSGRTFLAWPTAGFSS